MKPYLLIAACLVGVAAPAAAQDVRGTFVDLQGKEVGTATLTQTPNGVLISIEVRGLTPGAHAFHIHEKGSCDPATKFASAGGHYALGKKHGFNTEGGPHPGDMPNQFAEQDGVLHAEVIDPSVTLGSGNGTLLGPDGTALVIHAKADDYASQPAGNAGDRIACAPIKRP
jgi:Cu-Zn family superoxide dismutase